MTLARQYTALIGKGGSKEEADSSSSSSSAPPRITVPGSIALADLQLPDEHLVGALLRGCLQAALNEQRAGSAQMPALPQELRDGKSTKVPAPASQNFPPVLGDAWARSLERPAGSTSLLEGALGQAAAAAEEQQAAAAAGPRRSGRVKQQAVDRREGEKASVLAELREAQQRARDVEKAAAAWRGRSNACDVLDAQAHQLVGWLMAWDPRQRASMQQAEKVARGWMLAYEQAMGLE
jgi:hypothetical protein